MAIPGLYKFCDEWHKTGTVWLYSDPHFGDPDLPNRPSADEQVKMINAKCGKNDTLILLGDVGDLSYVPKLRARYKVLVMGNHDAGRTNYERKVDENGVDNRLFDEVYEGVLVIAEKLILSHEPVDVPWAFNIHGHVHATAGRKNDKRHFNCCADAINFTPINFNQWMKQGYLSRIETIHRQTIDSAIVRKRKRGGKKIGEK